MVMDDRRAQIPLMKLMIRCLSLILMLSLRVTHAADCMNRLDIVIAVDTTSSQTASSFENVKTEVKGIVSGFTIGQSHTRLALVSISKQARVVVNFDGVKSLSDFNAAVDSLTFSTDLVELYEGIKVTKDSVLSTARVLKTNKILIMVKDRRSGSAAVSGTAELSRMTSESAAVRTSGAVIHAVGIGGLWNILELEALYGTDYLLFKDKNKALESVKSLNNPVCADCPRKGASSKKLGLCYESSKHVANWRVDLAQNSAGLSVCRRELDLEFVSCTDKQSCSKMDRDVSACGSDGKVTIVNAWQYFDYKAQACVTMKTTSTVNCAEALKCPDQVADVIFLLDKSGSMGRDFRVLIAATRTLIESLNVGPDNVRVGIMKFGNSPETIVKYGSITDKAELLKAVDGMSDRIISTEATYTDKALRAARESLQVDGRKEVAKFVFVMTDGKSTLDQRTFEETRLIKNAGVTVYAIGIGKVNRGELETMTAPESSTNLAILDSFLYLVEWVEGFSKKMCIQLSAPNPKLCDDSVFLQSISECKYGKQQITRTEYKYDVNRNCIKSSRTTENRRCRSKCIDPIDGNEYFDGDSWTSLCHEFQCSGSANPFVPQKSKCLAADGTCKDVGSQLFKCRDESNVETDNCQCVLKSGRPVLVIDTQ